MPLIPPNVRATLSGKHGLLAASLGWVIPATLLCALFIATFTYLGDITIHHWAVIGWDNAFNEWMRGRTSPTGLHFIAIVTNIGSPGVWVLVAVISIWLIQQKELSLTIFFLAVNLGGLTIQRSIKYLVHRPRPPLADQYLHSATFSFPSGHVTGSTVCYLLIAYILCTVYSWRGVQSTITYGLAFLMITFISGTRLYLGVHYLSDVVVGFTIMLLWVVTCLQIRASFTRPDEHHPKI